MSTKAKSSKVQIPDDPDPTPIHSSDTTQEVQGAARNYRKKVTANYNRGKTILAGNSSVDNNNKKTILGG